MSVQAHGSQSCRLNLQKCAATDLSCLAASCCHAALVEKLPVLSPTSAEVSLIAGSLQVGPQLHSPSGFVR